MQFQSTLPRRERPPIPADFSQTADFNPRSREGSDIMAEVKEAGLKLFQSTLPRRERRERRAAEICVHHFNPRSREGSDWMIRQSQTIT